MLKNPSIFALLPFALLAGGCGGAAGQPEREPGNQSLVNPPAANYPVDATNHYGPLVVHPTGDEGESAETPNRPWSSYWYPLGDDLMINPGPRNGGQSTLEKFDKYAAKAFNRTTHAQVFERGDIGLFDPSAEGSAGRCYALAFAAILEEEPVLPREGVTVSGVTFYTRDVKALLIKLYEGIGKDGYVQFGRIYGDALDDVQDIYPDQFHRVMQAELFEKRRAFIVDTDSRGEKWNIPVWWANTRIERDAANPGVMHVTTSLKGAKSTFVDPDFAGLANIVYTYTYDLYGVPQPDGSLKVTSGAWTGDSLSTHPDYLYAVPARGSVITHASANKQLDREIAYDILAKTGAFTRPAGGGR